MNLSDSPLNTEALRLGYYETSRSFRENIVHYIKDGVTLTINFEKKTASLWGMVGMVELEIKDFSFPHPRFEIFEIQIRNALRACELYDTKRID